MNLVYFRSDVISLNNIYVALESGVNKMDIYFQEISTTECTDEAGKVLKQSNDNPFIIESTQQPNVVDMRGK